MGYIFKDQKRYSIDKIINLNIDDQSRICLYLGICLKIVRFRTKLDVKNIH